MYVVEFELPNLHLCGRVQFDLLYLHVCGTVCAFTYVNYNVMCVDTRMYSDTRMYITL